MRTTSMFFKRTSRFFRGSLVVVFLGGGATIVFGMVLQCRSGALFGRYRDREGLWTSHGEQLIGGAAAVLVGIGWVLWEWIKRRRDEASLLKRYGKRR
jgi:hypothetical protein